MSAPYPGSPDLIEFDLRKPASNTYEGRLPDPAELVQWGGKPGVQYLLVAVDNVTEATKLPPVTIANKPCKWGMTKGTELYEVVGPKGSVSVMLLSRGLPIPDTDPSNGIRRWFYDRSILERTGLKAPYGGNDAQQVSQAAQDDESSSSQPQVRQKGGDSAVGGKEVRAG